MTQNSSLEFSVINKETGESVIFITQDPTKNELNFTFTYTGASAITLKGGSPVAEKNITSSGPTSLYFTISTILSQEEYDAIDITLPAGWQAKKFTEWALTPIENITVKSGDSFTFTLTDIRADGQAGPGSFNIDFYNIPSVQDSGTQLNLSLEALPSSHKNLRDVLSLSFVDGNEVFIDVDDMSQIPSNTLILRLDNTSLKPIVPTGTATTKTPVFYLTFVTANGAPGYGALTTVDRLKNIRVGTYKDYGTEWTIQDRTQSDPPHWAIYPKSPEILGTGAKAIAEFRIDNIVTDFAPSSTNLYLQSSDIPGYDDGTQALAVEKCVPVLAIKDFTNQQNNVESGTEVCLTWKTFNANRCSLSPVDDGAVDVPVQGGEGYKVYPDRTTTYTLTAFDDALAQKTAKAVTVDVLDVKITDFAATPSSGGHYGDPVSLSWHTVSATSCTIDPPINGSEKVDKNVSSQVIHPMEYTRYTLTANGQGGPVTRELVVFPIPDGWKKVENSGLWNTWGRPVMLSYKEQLWFMAGGPEDAHSWVFRTYDGFNWDVKTNHAAFSPRGEAAGCVFDNKMWLMGGKTAAGVVDEVWYSTDGDNWLKAEASEHWSARSGHGCIAFDGKLWVIGGKDAAGKVLNDVWSSTDGISWHQEASSAIWPARTEFGLTIYQDSLCIVAGKTLDGVLSDVWLSRDGKAWHGLEKPTTWLGRRTPNVHALDDKLYVIGGCDRNGNAINNDYILLSNGSWSMGLVRGSKNLIDEGSAVFHGALWFAGGTIDGEANKTVWAFGPSSTTMNQ